MPARAYLATIFLALLASRPLPALPGDWPCWRGPGRDGQVEGFQAPASWPKTLREVWRVTVGEGHSSPVVVGDQVFLHTREGDEEVVRSLSVATGAPTWKKSYAAAYKVNPEADSHGAGPKSTPAALSGRLFTLGIGGILSAFDAKTGQVLWRRDFSREFEKTSPLYGTAASPLAEGPLCIAPVGGHDRGALRAFAADSGETRWSLDGDGPGYASPTVMDLAGKRQLVTQSQNRLVGVDLRTGQLLWSVPWTTKYDQNSVTSLVSGDLLITSGYGKPAVAFRVTGDGSSIAAKEAWSNPDATMFMSSPVLAGGSMFGMSSRQKGQLFAIDPSTGKTLWKGPGRLGENAALLASGSIIVALTNDADLLFLDASKARFEELARYKVATTPTWAHPVLAGGRILIKDRSSIACFSLAGGG